MIIKVLMKNEKITFIPNFAWVAEARLMQNSGLYVKYEISELINKS